MDSKSFKRNIKRFEHDEDEENSFLMLDERKQAIVRKVAHRWKAFRRRERVVPVEKKDDVANNVEVEREDMRLKTGMALPSTYFRLSMTGNDLAYRHLETSAKRVESKKGVDLRELLGSLSRDWRHTLKKPSDFGTLLDDDEFCDFDSEDDGEKLASPLPRFNSMPNLLEVSSDLYKQREARKALRRALSDPEIKRE